MNNPRIKFRQEIGSLAVIQGTIERRGELLEFEMAMTESITDPVSGVIKRSIKLSDLESIELKRRYFRKSKMTFSAASLSTFEKIPNSKGFNYTIFVDTSHQQAESFLRDVLFEMTQIEMESLGRRFEQ